MSTPATPRPHQSPPVIVPPSNCFTVLVVDDQLPNRLLLRKFLQAIGYAVVEAADGVEALGLLAGERPLRPDLVITDIEMPNLNGISLIQEIRQLEGASAGVPIMAASGNADMEMSRDVRQAGADLFLTKPFDLSDLRRDVARLITGKRRSSDGKSTDSSGSETNRISEIGLVQSQKTDSAVGVGK